MAAPLLEATGVRVRRGRRVVLGAVDVELSPGALVHLTGANGSGKTSLLRVLAGLAAPAGGRLRRPAACAFVPERVVLAAALRPREWLGAMRALRGLAPVDATPSLEAAGLDPAVLDEPAARLSKGMLQRIALIEALDAGCPVLLLDEPFAGLDRDGRAWLARELAERADEGAGVLLTDHAGDAAGRLPRTQVLELRAGACVVA
jgi:ABC-type multidrug transport system ATPase subunit